MYDVLIKGGRIYDGGGKEPFEADVAIKGGKIVSVGATCAGEAARTIDASGLAVMPGAIDAHSHSDLTLPVHNRAESSIRQGITTEVAGSCGWSMAPCKQETIDTVLKSLIDALASEQDFKAMSWEWRTFSEYLAALEKKGIATNLVPIVGQSLIRAHIMGRDNRPASKGELEAMKAILRESMEDGAKGLSTGRSYEPGCFAATEEIIELAKVTAEYGGIYTTHIKDEGNEEFAAVEEAIRIGREAGLPVEVSHHKSIGAANFGKVNRTLQMMEEARCQGVDINCDVYPYDFAQISFLWRVLPDKLARVGKQELLSKLPDRSFRDQVKAELAKRTGTFGGAGFAANYLVVSCPLRRDLEWKTFQDIAGSGDVVDALCDLLFETKLAVKAAGRMNETDVQTVIKHPATMIGTDAFALDRDMGEDVAIHPRHYGTFPRVLGHYARDVGLVGLAEMVRKVTSLPAGKFALGDRGWVKEGFWADLLVFDPATIVDRATAEAPAAHPAGIEYVLVNGTTVLEKGQYRPAFTGRVLRRRAGC